MDTTETLGGTYFYHGHDNVTKDELLWLIFIESLADHTGMAVETAATIIAGQPIIPKRQVLGSKGKRTSIASKMARRIFNNARFPNGIRLETLVLGEVRHTNKIGAAVGRAFPYLGYAQAVILIIQVSKDTRNKYNLIARPEHRIAWTYF
ncbi:STM2901 family protein [Rahnella woolbedingensis]|uniref:Uncharacterized protein n=1 Tax=Rahnella woolbedingensis TaxID=1510574 RepID=A0A419N3A7_9GAMM|nr:hypothetical protein [Rahnella woolbedingensis]RJT37441.1 hypothetical protein D6C13_22060 [Rahnella woolbedingensis]